MKPEELRKLTDEANKEEIKQVYKKMKEAANLGRNYVYIETPGAVSDYFVRVGYTVEGSPSIDSNEKWFISW